LELGATQRSQLRCSAGASPAKDVYFFRGAATTLWEQVSEATIRRKLLIVAAKLDLLIPVVIEIDISNRFFAVGLYRTAA
jgi:hypothetical protein